MIRVLLADDEVILRESLQFILERDEEIEITGSVGNGFEALKSCRMLKPDIILMDIMMPECDGVEGTRLIKEIFPEIRILILTTFKDDEYVCKALKYGADGYLLKDVRPNELIKVIKNSTYALRTLHYDILKVIVNQMQQNTGINLETSISDYKLSDREIEIIRQVVNGKSNREIASSLYLTEGSVKNSITVLLNKLKLNDRTQLAVFAVRNNIV